MYKKEERCPYCLGMNLRPKGWNRKKTKRRLKCQNCKKHLTKNGKSWFIDKTGFPFNVGQILSQISLIPQIFIDFQEFAKIVYFQCVQLYVGSHKTQIELVNALLLERLNLRGICRVLKISLIWLLKYISQLYDEQPDDLNYRQNKANEGKVNLQLIDSELDEMWSFAGNKKINNGFG